MKPAGKACYCIDLLPDPAVIVDENGLLLKANVSFEEVTGLNQKKIVGKTFTEIKGLSAESKKILMDNLRKRIQGLPVQPYEIAFTDKNCKVRYTEINAKKISYAGRHADLVVFRDITEHKRTEENLKQEHYKLEAIANSIGAGFVVISKDYHIVWANEFIKKSKGDVEGKPCYAVLYSLNKQCPNCGVKKVFEQSVLSDSHECKSTDAKGSPYWVELIATPIKDAAGKVEMAVEVCLDITEKKKLQRRLADYSHNLENVVKERTEQLRQAQDKLVKSERFAAIGELAGMVGHDLRNPLTGISNAVYFIRKKMPSCSDETVKDMFKIIDSAILHADKIINDLLEYSREIKLELVECTPKSLVEEALSLVNVPNRVRIVDKTQKEPLFKADKNKLSRVFVNLLKNAIDAIPTIGNIKIKSSRTNGNVKISFTDTGIGIPKEKLSKLFSPLITTKAQGMGFGLAICKRMVEAHQGKITVESTLGKGTTVTIISPLEPKLEKGTATTCVLEPESSLLTTKT